MSSGLMRFRDGSGNSGDSVPEAEVRLDRLFYAYREALPDPQPGVNFMPELWTRIERRRASSDWFSRLAKGLVTAAVALYVILALLTPSGENSAAYFNGTFVDALVAEHVSSLEPLHLERISQVQVERE